MDGKFNYNAQLFRNYRVRMAEPGDADMLLKLVNANRHRISAYFPGIIKFCGSLQELKDHITTRSRESAQGKYVIMLIEDEHGKLVGLVQLKDIDFNARKREIGAFLDERHEGSSIMQEALSCLFSREFADHGINKIFLRTAESNSRARRLAERLGFKMEGLIREDFMDSDGNYLNLLYFGLLRREWVPTDSNAV